MPHLDIQNNKAKKAWELYDKVKHTADAPQLLRLVANDSYIVRILYKLKIKFVFRQKTTFTP